MEWTDVTGALTNLGSVMTTVFDAVVDNPLLMVCICVPVFSAGIAAVRKLFSVAQGA